MAANMPAQPHPPERQDPTVSAADSLPPKGRRAGDLVDIAVGRPEVGPLIPARLSVHRPDKRGAGPLELARAASMSSTTKPATGPVEKCRCSESLGPNTSTREPSGSRKMAKSGSE